MGTSGTAKVVVTDMMDVEYNLSVDYSVTKGCPAHYDRNYGWSPPEGPELEIDDIRCTSMVYNYGRRIVVEIPDDDQLALGNFCNENFEERIRELVEEFAGQSIQERDDHDDS